MGKDVYVKIYTKENNNILVFEGINSENKDYYFAKGSVFGCGVTGKEHISITKEAKILMKKIFETAQKTGDDLSCLDLFKLEDGRIHLGWIGKRYTEIDIRTLEKEGFWIGTGEITPDLSFIEQLSDQEIEEKEKK